METKEYGAYDRSPNSSDSSPLSPYRSLAVEMDPEALAHAEGAAFSLSRIPIAPTEIESRQEMWDETDAPTWGEEFERVEPIQESKNQRLADVAGMAETGTDGRCVACPPGICVACAPGICVACPPGLFTFLCINLSRYLAIQLSTYLVIYLSTYRPVYLCTCLPIYVSTDPPFFLSTYRPI